MSHEDDQLPGIADRVIFSLARAIDFSRTDTESTQAKVRLRTAAATHFNTLAVTEYGERVGPTRATELVEQVIAAAFQSSGSWEFTDQR
jgi:hypothetical protein